MILHTENMKGESAPTEAGSRYTEKIMDLFSISELNISLCVLRLSVAVRTVWLLVAVL